MIAENENLEPAEIEEPEEPKLTPQNMHALLHILMTVAKGITIPQKTFDEYPEDSRINITFDEVNQLWRMWVPPPKHKRGLILHKKRIILPN